MSEDFMSKHFEAAGIKDDEPKQEPVENQDGEQKQDDAQGAEQQQEKQEPASGTEQGEQQQPAPVQQDKPSGKPDGKKESGKEEKGSRPAGPGDLTLQDGSIVRAGAERRHYESLQHERQMHAATKQEMNSWKQRAESNQTKLSAIEEASKGLQGLDPVEVSKAVRLYSDLRTNPQGTMKQLLVDLKGLGYDFAEIGGGVDTAAIINAINQNKGSEEKPTQQQVDEVAAQEVHNFITTFPDARLHENEIAYIIEQAQAQGKQVSLVDAYSALKLQVINAGLDWSKPIVPQIEAAQAAQTQQQQQTKQNDPKPVNGNGAVPSNSDLFDPTKFTDQAETTEDAVLAAMKEAGYTYSR